MIFSNSKVYDVVKWLIIVGLPSVSVFIATLGQIYGFNSDIIVLTINAVAVLLGSLLGVLCAFNNRFRTSKDYER